MRTRVDDQRGYTVVEVTTELTLAHAREFRAFVDLLLGRGDVNLVLDLAECRIDTTGLAMLVIVRGDAIRAGGDLRIASPSAQVSALLADTGLARIIEVFAVAEHAYENREHPVASARPIRQRSVEQQVDAEPAL